MNEHGIGICLVGNFETRTPGARQLASLHALLTHLRADGLPGTNVPKVTVHRWVDRGHTVCPGRRFPFNDLKRRYGATA
jgi:N-acetyl-anhydromuramyl-L-alanine amidase AmpD